MIIQNLVRNGEFLGWGDIRTVMMGKEVSAMTGLKYGDNIEFENVMGAGRMPIGRSSGNYKAEASIGLFKEEVTQLLLSIGTSYRLQDIAPFDIVVMYKYGGVVLKDIIRGCQFKGNEVDTKQNDKTISSTYELIVSHIDWRLAV